MNIPRPEHPKPQFERENWENLNGLWDFEIDNSRSGKERGLSSPDAKLSMKINVPFCPESKLSGIQNTDFLYGVWYKRNFDVKSTDGIVYLHFGAVDYRCEVYVNGSFAGSHKGGYTSFKFDISEFVKRGENILTVYAEDDCRDRLIPRGKQSNRYNSYGCLYTRTTGIWQTVWLEYVPKTHIENIKLFPDYKSGILNAQIFLAGAAELKVKALYEGKEVGHYELLSSGGICEISLNLSEIHLWEVGHGRLYDLYLEYGEDKVKSYFGLRNIRLDGYKFKINDRSVFQKLVLDQGFYPDGIYTAPDDRELLGDIQRSIACGFNGARLHEKIFEERFLYYCDKLGYIVWGEYPNWGLDVSYPEAIFSVLPEWLEELDRDFNHPAIIGWCPFNETWDSNGRKQCDDIIDLVYKTTLAVDNTRPCIDTSGAFHVNTVIYDQHDYTQNPDEFKKRYEHIGEGKISDPFPQRQHYSGGPFFISEYGGIKWSDKEGAWGYGNAPKTKEEFIERFEKLSRYIMENKYIFGFCYTQLTDVEQEQNGLYYYDRTPKFSTELYRKCLDVKPAIEEES